MLNVSLASSVLVFLLSYIIPRPILALHHSSRAHQRIPKDMHCFHCEWMISCFMCAWRCTRCMFSLCVCRDFHFKVSHKRLSSFALVPFQSQTIWFDFTLGSGALRYSEKKTVLTHIISLNGKHGSSQTIPEIWIDLDLRRRVECPALYQILQDWL